MIEVKQLDITRGSRPVLSGISCTIVPGKITAVMGPNGAGKTSLLESLTGRLPFQAGQVIWDGLPFEQMSDRELAGRRSVLSQKLQLSFPMEVSELVEMGTYAQYKRLKASQRQQLVNRALDALDLQAFRNRNFQQLSGGEQQRVLLAKCMTQLASSRSRYEHQYLFLDEPTNNLDIEQQYRLMEQVRHLARSRQIGIFVIIHDLNLAAQFADHLILLKDGLLQHQGTPDDVLTSDILKATFNIHSIIQRHPLLACPLITVIPYEIHNQSESTPCCPESRTTPSAKTRPGQSAIRQ